MKEIDVKIIVVGGGIGGTAAAAALHRKGHEVLVLEQAPAIGDVGAGVFTTANGVKALEYLGVHEAIQATSVSVEAQYYLGLEDDRELVTIPLGQEALDHYGAPAYFIHRADMLSALSGQIDPSRIRLGARVVGVDQDEHSATVVLDSGERLTADLVVGADGIKSALREQLVGSAHPRFTGTVGWRALIPLDKLAHIDLEPHGQHAWFGAGRSAVAYPMRDDSVYNLVAFVPAGEVTRESWTVSGDVSDLRASFAGSCDRLLSIIDAVDDAFLTGLYFRDAIDEWVYGRVVLLGDAAHPVLPTVGQGATMALEDAVVLAESIESMARLSDGLSLFHRLRADRTRHSLEVSRVNALLMNFEGEADIRARDGRYKGLSAIDPHGWAMHGWLWEYDPTVAVSGAQRTGEAVEPDPTWSRVITSEDRAGAWEGERAAIARALQGDADDRAVSSSLGGVPVVEVDAAAEETSPVILLVHGGGFTMGSAHAASGLAGRYADAFAARVVAVDYRLAPEHPYPAALDDLEAVYRRLREATSGRLCYVVGDDAGANLALALCARLIRSGGPLPAALHLTSPFVDLTVPDRGAEGWPDRRTALWWSAGYRVDADPRDPELSPLFADLQGLPPVLLEIGDADPLAHDGRDLYERLRAAGNNVELVELPGAVHGFVQFVELAESERAIDRFRNFTGVRVD
jgi:salicylate hydroxylase